MMSEFSNDPHQEQSRDLIGRTDNFEDRPEIRSEFIKILHRLLDEIKLSEELIITDPFILNSYANWYQDFLKRIFEPLYPKVKRITFVTSAQKNESLFQNLENHARPYKVRLRFFINDTYHDRFWLSKGNKKGVYVGNSLTGIGAKYCFIGLLPDADALAAYQLLYPHL
jgi:hypothetical protein